LYAKFGVADVKVYVIDVNVYVIESLFHKKTFLLGNKKVFSEITTGLLYRWWCFGRCCAGTTKELCNISYFVFISSYFGTRFVLAVAIVC